MKISEEMWKVAEFRTIAEIGIGVRVPTSHTLDVMKRHLGLK